MKSDISAVCVYCASSTGSDPRFGEAADAFGMLLATEGIRLVYGGGAVGLMGRVADACMAAGGEVYGVIPSGLFGREVAHDALTQLIEVRSMHERKQRMYELSDGFVALPGGLGTLEELAEITTWSQLGVHNHPIVVLDLAGFWSGLRDWLLGAQTAGLVKPANAELITWVESVPEVLSALRAYDAPYTPKWLDPDQT